MSRKTITPLLFAVIFSWVAPTAAIAQTPVGGEVQANVSTTGHQRLPAIAAAADGRFVVAWQSASSAGGDASSYSVQIRRFEADGSPLAGEEQVNTLQGGAQWNADVAMADDGRFVVVWESYAGGGADSDGTSIRARRYDSAGGAVGAEFEVNSHTPGFQRTPAIDLRDDGSFFVAWTSATSPGTDNFGFSVVGRRFDSVGGAIGDDFQINDWTTSQQLSPDVAFDADGDAIVGFYSFGSPGTDSDNAGVQARRFDSAGAPVGGQFQINVVTTGRQAFEALAVADDGSFVVIWDSDAALAPDDGRSIQARRFDSAGGAVGGEFQVNSWTTDTQRYPAVALSDSGSFVVAWGSFGAHCPDDSVSSVQMQRFSPAGSFVGGELQVNSFTVDAQDRPAVAVDGAGNFVIAWESFGSGGDDSDATSVQIQRYLGPVPVLLRRFSIE